MAAPQHISIILMWWWSTWLVVVYLVVLTDGVVAARLASACVGREARADVAGHRQRY